MPKTPPRAPTKTRKRQSPMYGSPGRVSPMYGSPGSGSPGRGSVFNFGSPIRSPGSGSPGFNYGSPLKKMKNSPSILTNQKDAKPGRIVNKQGNAAVKSYETDRLSEKSLANELAVYEHLDIMYRGKKIRDLINERFQDVNSKSKIYQGVNLIFPRKIKLENNELHLSYHDIEDVFINRSIIAPSYIDENGVKWPNDPELYEEDKQLRENIKIALKEYGIIYADKDDIDEEIKSNLFRTTDGDALLLDFETSEVNTSKGGRKKRTKKQRGGMESEDSPENVPTPNILSREVIEHNGLKRGDIFRLKGEDEIFRVIDIERRGDIVGINAEIYPGNIPVGTPYNSFRRIHFNVAYDRYRSIERSVSKKPFIKRRGGKRKRTRKKRNIKKN